MTRGADVHVAPVLPAETNALARPSATRFAQTRTDELRLRRNGARAVSSMVTTSRASKTSIVARNPTGLGELFPDDFFQADQDDLDGKLSRRQEGTLHHFRRRMIAAHGVEGYADDLSHRRCWLKRVLDGDDFTAFVEATFRTDTVWHLRFMALRARRQRLRFQEVMRTTRACASSRVAPFWVRHLVAPLRVGQWSGGQWSVVRFCL